MRQLHGAEDLEGRRKLPEGVFLEIVQHGTDGAIVAIPFLVEHRGELLRPLPEGFLLETDQQDRNPRRAEVGLGPRGGAALEIGRHAAGQGVVLDGGQGEGGRRGTPEPTRLAHHHGARFVRHPVTEFITMDAEGDPGPVRLGHHDLARIGGRGGERHRSDEQYGRQCKNPFHTAHFLTMKPLPRMSESHSLAASAFSTETV